LRLVKLSPREKEVVEAHLPPNRHNPNVDVSRLLRINAFLKRQDILNLFQKAKHIPSPSPKQGGSPTCESAPP